MTQWSFLCPGHELKPQCQREKVSFFYLFGQCRFTDCLLHSSSRLSPRATPENTTVVPVPWECYFTKDYIHTHKCGVCSRGQWLQGRRNRSNKNISVALDQSSGLLGPSALFYVQLSIPLSLPLPPSAHHYQLWRNRASTYLRRGKGPLYRLSHFCLQDVKFI